MDCSGTVHTIACSIDTQVLKSWHCNTFSQCGCWLRQASWNFPSLLQSLASAYCLNVLPKASAISSAAVLACLPTNLLFLAAGALVEADSCDAAGFIPFVFFFLLWLAGGRGALLRVHRARLRARRDHAQQSARRSGAHESSNSLNATTLARRVDYSTTAKT